MNKRAIGAGCEQLACRYLEEQGYIIKTCNFFCRAGELDIVAQDNEYLCFIEVKYRKNTLNGYPEEAVDYRKTARITNAARAYMNRYRYSEETPCRFDVVAILGESITLYKNAFDAC